MQRTGLLYIVLLCQRNAEVNSSGKAICQHPSCSMRSTFGYIIEGKPRFCVAHKPSGSVDIRNPRCLFSNCMRQASFGNVSDKVPSFCVSHRGITDVSLHARRCAYIHGCSKYSVFGDASDGIPRFCVAHKEDRHINVLRPWCR